MIIGVSNHLRNAFRFHYHSQEVIGFLGMEKFGEVYPMSIILKKKSHSLKMKAPANHVAPANQTRTLKSSAQATLQCLHHVPDLKEAIQTYTPPSAEA